MTKTEFNRKARAIPADSTVKLAIRRALEALVVRPSVGNAGLVRRHVLTSVWQKEGDRGLYHLAFVIIGTRRGAFKFAVLSANDYLFLGAFATSRAALLAG